MKKYEKTAAAVFPLGGIGAGSIGLRGNGSLCQWEIFNRPDRCTINPFSHFAVKAERDGKVIDSRVLEGDARGSFMGDVSKGTELWVYGNGVDRGTMAGARHFRTAEFSAFYPLAQIDFKDEHFPGSVTMRAASPFIPMDSMSSGLPCAIFNFEIFNDSNEDTDYTVAFSVNNLFSGERKNRHTMIDNTHCMHLYCEGIGEDDVKYGNMTVAAPDGEVSYQEHWYRGGWFDELCTFLRDFSALGPLKNREYSDSWQGYTDVCTTASRVTVKAGEKKSIRFILTWYAPNIEKYWDPRRQKMKNYYSTVFNSSLSVARHILKKYDYLWQNTLLFCETLENQSIPEPMLDAVQANLAILKSTVCLRLEDGTLWGWEGVTEKSGSCEGSCTHVWNYAYSMAFLFPDLERSIHDAEFKYSIDSDGKMAFRTMLPLGSKMSGFRACVDGQMGTVIKVYRDWKLCGDINYISEKWDKIKSIIAYAWSDRNPDRWDSEKSGLLSGRCHHTLDMELFGASSWLEGYYLGALKAAAEMAAALGDTEAESEYTVLFENGKRLAEESLFNGEYYCQRIDLSDKSIPDAYEMGELLNSTGYWNDEAGEIKYQIGDGCAITAVISDWQCRLCGPGEVFDSERRKSTLRAIHRYNFKSMRDIDNSCRIFALNDECGTVICSWDNAAKLPAIPLTYAEECMSGFEYAIAAEMLQDGMTEEAEKTVAAVRERYDGEHRDPWAEIECGASYARSMSSYSLLIAYSGFSADAVRSRMEFKPIANGRYFWSFGGAWGVADCGSSSLKLRALWGEVHLKELGCSFTPIRITLDSEAVEMSDDGKFDVVLRRGSVISAEG